MGLFLGEYNINTALEVAREESYDRGRIEGKLEGRIEGKMEGIREGYKSTARNLLSMGLSIEDIAKATGLSKKDIEAL